MSAALRLVNDRTSDAGWLTGVPMDPSAVSLEPLPTIPGYPIATAGAGHIIVGPTGGGRSTFVQACAYDAALSGIRTGYLGHEVTSPEFNARAVEIARCREHQVNDVLRAQLANVRYLELGPVLAEAVNDPDWGSKARAHFDVFIVDPVSGAGSTLGLDFDRSNADYAKFYDTIVQPFVTAGGATILLENVGLDPTAGKRSKGASAKSDRADYTFWCRAQKDPAALIIAVDKVRSIRAPFKRGDEWIFDRDTLRTKRRTAGPDDTPTITLRPTVLMERVSRELEQTPGLGTRQLRETVSGKATEIDLAIRALISEGHVRIIDQGAGKRTEHHIDRPYRVAEDPRKADRAPRVPTVLPPASRNTATEPCHRAPGVRSSRDTGAHGEGDTPNVPTVTPHLNGAVTA